MRVLVAGATGAIGRSLVPMLVKAGHEVVGTSRSAEREREIVALGAVPQVMDALDPAAVDAAVRAARPDVIVHQLTALPAVLDLRKPDVYEMTNRLRREGTKNLIDAARNAGVKRMVAQSIAFAYRPEGGAIKREDDPLARDAAEPFGAGVEAVEKLEAQVTGTTGVSGTVLRYGWFYGPGTYFGEGGFIAGEVKRWRFPVIGRGHALYSFIHVDDAASATVVAIEADRPGIYNVVDDDPITQAEWLPLYAASLGARKPLRVPTFVARLAAGKVVAEMASGLRGASNAKAKRELGWRPRYESVRDVWA